MSFWKKKKTTQFFLDSDQNNAPCADAHTGADMADALLNGTH